MQPIENTSTNLGQNRFIRFSLASLLDTLYFRKRIIAATVCAILGLAVLLHFFHQRYTTTAVISISTSSDSPVSALLGGESKAGMASQFFDKGKDTVTKTLLNLNSRHFFLSAARKLQSENDPELVTAREGLLKRSAMSRLKSHVFSNQIIDPDSKEARQESLATALEKMARISKSGFDNVQIQVTTNDFNHSVLWGNFLSTVAVEELRREELAELNQAQDFFDHEYDTSSKRLTIVDNETVGYRRHSDLVISDVKAGTVASRVVQLERTLDDRNLQLDENQKQIDLLTTQLEKRETELFDSNSVGPSVLDAIYMLRERVQGLQGKKTKMLAQGYELRSRPMADIDVQISENGDKLKALLAKADVKKGIVVPELYGGLASRLTELKLSTHSIEENMEFLKKDLREAKAQAERLPGAQQVLVNLHRRTQMEYSLMTEFRRKLLQVEELRLSLNSRIRVIEAATIQGIGVPLSLIGKLFVALVLGLALGPALALVLDLQQTYIQSQDDLVDLGLTCLGSVPAMAVTPTPQIRNGRAVADSPSGIALRHIIAKLLRHMNERTGQMVLLLSPGKSDGTPRLCSQMASLLAALQHRVLVVDADLRHAPLSRIWKTNDRPGLNGILSLGLEASQEIVKVVDSHLDFLPAGSSSHPPVERLNSIAFKDLLAELKQQYDYIIVHTGPLFSSPECWALADWSDLPLLVAALRKTKREEIQLALQTLHQMTSRTVLGVLNGTRKLEYASSLQSDAEGKLASGPVAFWRGILGFGMREI